MTSPSVEIHVARSRALEQYSTLEHSLCLLMAALLKTDPSLAAHVFYRLGATARNRMLEALLSARFGNQYDDYWYGSKDSRDTGLIKIIRGLDETRHKLAHWTVSSFTYPEDQKNKNGVFVVKPEFWAVPNEPTKIGASDMVAFVERGVFATVNINNFTGIVAESPFVGCDRERQDTWRAIFSQPITYPPPMDHPLAARNQ